jgi:ABC-type multidrug transport system fused ATPase/permease subunit
VAEYGENLSQGERQLLIMAKATLSRSRIVLFDEASSSLDSATDALVQRMIRESFTDSTLISIAHRLSTIIDSDKIVVMDKGLAVEFASPATLLADSSSKFSSMLQELGPDMAAGLRDAANRAALKRRSTAR